MQVNAAADVIHTCVLWQYILYCLRQRLTAHLGLVLAIYCELESSSNLAIAYQFSLQFKSSGFKHLNLIIGFGNLVGSSVPERSQLSAVRGECTARPSVTALLPEGP